MANKPISMHRVKQILLFLSNSFSERAISCELSISRVTISRCKSSFLSSGLDYQGLLNLSDTAPEDLVSGNRKEGNKPIDPRKSRIISQAGYFWSVYLCCDEIIAPALADEIIDRLSARAHKI